MKKKSEARVLGPYKHHSGGAFVVEIDATGKRSSSVFPTWAKAERYIEMMRAELEKSDHTTEGAFEQYKIHLAAKGTKQDAIDVVEWAVLLFFPSPVPLSLLSGRRCQALYDDVRTRPSKATGKPLAADTHRGALARVKAFLAWCTASPQNWIKANPFSEVKGIGKLRPRGKSLGKSGNELRVKGARAWYTKALSLAATGDEGAIVGLTALLLGMRAGEIVSRVVGDLDTDTAAADLLWIPCSKTPAGRRTLEVPEVLRPFLLLLAEGKADDRPLFELSPGVAHDSEWVRKQVHRVCDAAEVPRVTAHSMRGLLATLTAERGLAGHLIAATLGHTADAAITRTAYMAPGAEATGINRRGLLVLNGGAK